MIDLEKLPVTQVVMDNSGHAWQKREDGVWLFAGTEFSGDMDQYAPFTKLQSGETPWEFPPEVEEVFGMAEAEGSLVVRVNDLRVAMARARLNGTYAAIRGDYEVAAQALCDAAEVLERKGMDDAARELQKLCEALSTPHDD